MLSKPDLHTNLLPDLGIDNPQGARQNPSIIHSHERTL